MDFVETIHGEVRWLVLIVALIALVRFALGWLQRRDYKGMDRGLMSGFAGLMDLNLLLGLTLLIFDGGFNALRLEHAGTMVLAIVVAHSAAAWRRTDNASLKFRNNLAVVIVALALVFVGVTRLRGGWLY